MYRNFNFVFVFPWKYEETPSKVGYFSKIANLFTTVLTVQLSTVSDRALIFPTPLLSQLQGWPGCQKIQFFFFQINLLSFCARIEPKLSKLQKTVKIDKRSSKKPCFLIVFRIFSILGSILAQKTTKSKYLSIVPFICHPGHPWSCESNGLNNSATWWLFSIFPKWSLRLP